MEPLLAVFRRWATDVRASIMHGPVRPVATAGTSPPQPRTGWNEDADGRGLQLLVLAELPA
eukprot:m.32030 g.32030  ORF g.32030 m.32030 type:complete len:61 (+) comp8372_c0_seq1:243-425(+)